MIKIIYKASPLRIFLNTFAILGDSIMNRLFGVYLLSILINSISKGLTFTYMLTFLVCMGIIQILFLVFKHIYFELYEPKSDQKIFHYIQTRVFIKATEVELALFEKPDFYDNYVKAATEVNERSQKILESLGNFFSSLAILFIVSFYIFKIDIGLIIFALFPLLMSLIFGNKLNKIRYKYNMEMAQISRKKKYVRRIFYLNEYAKELRLSNIHIVLFKQFHEAVAGLIATIQKYGYKKAIIEYIFMISVDVIAFLGATLYASYRTLVTKSMSLGDCFVVINTINSVALSIKQIIDSILEFSDHAMYIQNLKVFLEYTPSMTDDNSGLSIEKGNFKSISLQNVSFRYEGQENYSLKNINLEINSNQKIAIVGHNGAGKSTLVNIIMRLYDTTKGEVLFNGTNIKKYNLFSYRNMFGTVFQDFKLYSLTIEQNIHLTNTKIEMENIDSVLKSSNIYDKVYSLKNKHKTILTKEFDENGEVFSGGEAQKIAIARAYVKDADILIFDEPTSALDPIAEYKIYESMMKLCRDKPVIFISHRMSSAILADYIYVLDKGQIIEEGNHSELIKLNGTYSKMYNQQTENYLDEDKVGL